MAKRRRTRIEASIGLMLLVLLVAGHGRGDPAGVRLSLDVREAPVQDIAGALVELGGFQVVFDPDVRCALTVKLHRADWLTALDTTLRACGLGRDESGGVLRVAPLSRLREEVEARRRLEEKHRAAPTGDLALFRLAWARAEAMAPLLERFVSPRGRVSLDPRTNTLLISY
jgi:type II secretory pathway component HofQ